MFEKIRAVGNIPTPITSALANHLPDVKSDFDTLPNWWKNLRTIRWPPTVTRERLQLLPEGVGPTRRQDRQGEQLCRIKTVLEKIGNHTFCYQICKNWKLHKGLPLFNVLLVYTTLGLSINDVTPLWVGVQGFSDDLYTFLKMWQLRGKALEGFIKIKVCLTSL